MDLPDLPPGYYFHVGRRHADERYSRDLVYGVQIRVRRIWPFARIVCAEACAPDPVSVLHGALTCASWLSADLHQKKVEDALTGRYVPGVHDLPDVEVWNATMNRKKAIGR